MTKAPTPTEMSKGQVTTQTTPQKSSIKQRLRTDLGRKIIYLHSWQMGVHRFSDGILSTLTHSG